MTSYRTIISNIRSMSRLLSADNLINDRVILSEIKAAANMIVTQSLEKRKYWQSPNLFSFIPCLEMEQIPLAECCDYIGTKMVSISKKALPKIGEGSFGSAVQGVFGLDGTVKFKETNPNRYSNLVKLNLKDADKYFWIRSDGRVVVTNSDTQAINLYAYFTELLPNSLLYPEVDCGCGGNYDVKSICANPLDQKFTFIDSKEFDLKQLVYKNLLSVYFGIQEDEQSNNKDESHRR